jgi:hypothetical protein
MSEDEGNELKQEINDRDDALEKADGLLRQVYSTVQIKKREQPERAAYWDDWIARYWEFKKQTGMDLD